MTDLPRLLEAVEDFITAAEQYRCASSPASDKYIPIEAAMIEARVKLRALLPIGEDVSARLQQPEQPCPHCHLPRDLPAICTPEVNAAIEQGIAHDAELFNRGRDHGLAEQAAALAETRDALRGLLAIHGVRDVASKSVFGSIVYVADELLARVDTHGASDALVPQRASEPTSTPSPVKEQEP